MNKTMTTTAVLLGVLLILSGSAAASGTGTKYYPDDYGTIFDPAFTSYPMPASTRTIADGAWQIWYDETPTSTDQTFDSTPFGYHLQLSDYATGHFEVGVAIVMPDDSSYSIASVIVAASGSATLYEGSIPMPGSWTIPAGHRLGFFVSNLVDAAEPVAGTPAQKNAAKAYNAHRALSIEIATDDAGVEPPTWFVTGTPYSPSMPVPELSTVALMGAGMGLVGVAAVVRSRKS